MRPLHVYFIKYAFRKPESTFRTTVLIGIATIDALLTHFLPINKDGKDNFSISFKRERKEL